jgi:SAM-dependent methyltransferase
LKETHRLLKPGGILSMRIDYKDHWSYFDNSIGPYNFLVYSKKKWKRYNPSLHYQNRMRHSDYLRIIKEVGFTLVKEDLDIPSIQLERRLRQLKIHSDFKSYSFDDLKILSSELVLIKESV